MLTTSRTHLCTECVLTKNKVKTSKNTLFDRETLFDEM
jgi:hypothetical protein